MRVCERILEPAQLIGQRQNMNSCKHDHPELKYDAGRSLHPYKCAHTATPQISARPAILCMQADESTHICWHVPVETAYLSDKWNTVNNRLNNYPSDLTCQNVPAAKKQEEG